jgi:UMF1 family MFS transporter
MSMPLQNRKQVLSWCFFDFANSGYSAVIVAVVFPVYYTGHIVGNAEGLGDLWWGRAISLSMLVVALSSPLLGGLADFTGRRKRFLLAFTLLCVACVASLSLIEQGMVIGGFLLVVLANIGMEGGLVFYNSYLPDISPREYQGRVSSWGFGLGYAGSMLALVLAIPLVKRDLFGAAWVMVAALFLVCSLPAFLNLPRDETRGRMSEGASRGMRYTWRTLKRIWADREAKKFLLAYFVYTDGVSTVIAFSSIYASVTLGFSTPELITLYLGVQASALAGAFAMSRRVDYWGPKKVVAGSLVLWGLVCILAYFVTVKTHFWAVAVIAGLGLGTVQAASRAFYAQFIPDGHESEYFGVYTLAGKSSAIMGPLVFGSVSSALGSQRPAILSVVLFFLAGLTVLAFVRGGGPNVKQVRLAE